MVQCHNSRGMVQKSTQAAVKILSVHLRIHQVDYNSIPEIVTRLKMIHETLSWTLILTRKVATNKLGKMNCMVNSLLSSVTKEIVRLVKRTLE